MEKELDFDELHQAVNALMDQETKSKDKKTPAESRAPKPDTPTVANASAPAEKDDGAVKVDVKRPLPQLTTHRGSRGRAMDVIGPKVAAKTTPPSAQTKRQAPTLQPTKDMVPESPAPVPEKSLPEPPKMDEPADDVLASLDMKEEPKAAEPLMSHSEWPDPLDLHGFKDEGDKPKTKNEEKVSAKEEPAPADTEQKSTQPPETENQKTAEDRDGTDTEPETPFVTTKVEKRPLGAYTTPAPEKPAEPTPAAEPDKPVTTTVQQPKELSPEVIAVESAEPEFRPTVPAAEQKQGDMQELRQMAIPQQYHTQDKQATTDARPVFDTKEYHPAIEAHSSKHKGRGWGWLMLLIFIVVLVGALAAAYYIMTGSLDFTALL